jgi:hypothetical protein
MKGQNMNTFSIPLSAIAPFTRGRDNIDPDKVNRLVELLQRGVELDAVAVFRRPGDTAWSISNGHHRVVAAESVGRTEIEATVVSGPWLRGRGGGRN